mmetsp:Transcript_11841/g.21633  ORF Transcript_11841/g.21633 Transcript_11841/m.21633 type:complete len:355 (+) Transcript_11841:110-1174(+)
MDSKKPWVLGVHTLMPYVQKNDAVIQKTILRENKGMLPPYVIAMGDTRRVRATASLLDEGSAVVLNDLMLEHGDNPGRVCVAVGTYKGTPVAMFEHQMGSSGAEIIVKEVIADGIMTNKFSLGNKVFNSDAKYMIRVGSAAGINCNDEGKKELRQPVVEAYDCVVANKQVGISCADYSALCGSLNAFERGDAGQVKTALKSMGYKFQDNWPVLETDKTLTSILSEKISEQVEIQNDKKTEKDVKLGKVYSLGNVSKDSLYAETEEEAFMSLRRNLDVGCSEMEFATISRVGANKTALGDPVRTAMAACILGSIPGDSFAEIDKSVANLVTRSALVGALETLHKVSLSHIQNGRE